MSFFTHAAWVAPLSFLAFSSQAAEIEIGQCGTPEAIIAQFRANDQHSIFSADASRKEKLAGVIFTRNPSGTVGYILEADTMVSEQPRQLCVTERLHQVRLYDARQRRMLRETLVNGDRAWVEPYCTKLINEGKTKDCKYHNDMLALIDSIGWSVLLQAQRVKKQAAGAYEYTGVLLTVVGDMNDEVLPIMRKCAGCARVYYTRDDVGLAVFAGTFTELRYSTAALQAFDSGRHVNPKPGAR